MTVFARVLGVGLFVPGSSMFTRNFNPPLPGTSASASGDIFTVLDRDHNGAISENEFMTALHGGLINSPLRNFDGSKSKNWPAVSAESYAKKGHFSGKEGKLVTCVGDSITRGACGSDGKSYPEQLQALLGDGYNVSAYAADGRGVLESGFFPIWNEADLLQEATESNPDIVLIMFGTNDARIEFSESEFKTQYDRLIKMFSELNSRPTLYMLTPPPVYDAGLEDHSVVAPNVNEKMIPILTDIASSHGLTLIDVFGGYESKCSDLNSTSCYLIAHTDPPPAEGKICENDYMHPSDEGYSLIAELVYKAIA